MHRHTANTHEKAAPVKMLYCICTVGMTNMWYKDEHRRSEAKAPDVWSSQQPEASRALIYLFCFFCCLFVTEAKQFDLNLQFTRVSCKLLMHPQGTSRRLHGNRGILCTRMSGLRIPSLAWQPPVGPPSPRIISLKVWNGYSAFAKLKPATGQTTTWPPARKKTNLKERGKENVFFFF